MQLREYQIDARDAVLDCWKQNKSALVVMATGCGKTAMFASCIDKHLLPGQRALVLAHRTELISQAADELRLWTDRSVDIEQAEHWAAESGVFERADVICAMVQTMMAGRDRRRMERFSPSDFACCIIDEGHHATADTYKTVLDHFRSNPALALAGVTATPDRADKEALGGVFNEVAFVYEIVNAIEDGWLVPIKARSVFLQELDLSDLRTVDGDFSDNAVGERVERVLARVAVEAMGCCGSRQTLAFCPTVKAAELLCAQLNGLRDGAARLVTGETPTDERRTMLDAYRDRAFQYLVNVDVATEGFNSPGIEVVLIARPTKSRARFAQMIGRGTRTLPGTVERLPDAEARRKAIAASLKPNLEVIDLAGNFGRHRLVTAADILGGRYSPEIVEKVTKRIRESGEPKDVLAELEEEQQKPPPPAAVAERTRKLAATVNSMHRLVDPFDLMGIRPYEKRNWERNKPPSFAMRVALEKFFCTKSRGQRKWIIDVEGLNYSQARHLIGNTIDRLERGLCTPVQAYWLAQFGRPTNVTRTEASAMLEQCFNKGKSQWSKKRTASTSAG